MIKNKISKELQEKLIKLRKDAEKKVSKPKTNVDSKELDTLKELGRKQGKQYDASAKCYEIDEEFKKNPPILYSLYVNGILSEQYYEKSFASKVEFLKENHFRVRKILNSKYIYGILFNVFGNAYVKRGGKKIFFNETTNSKTFLLKDGDILGTEKKSYIYGIKEGYSLGENNSTDIIIYPESEMKLSIDEKTTNSEHSFMDPNKVNDIIKKKSKAISTIQRLKNIELLNGIFYINIRRDKKDVNNFVKINPNYPRFSFEPYSNLSKAILEDTIKKIKRENLELSELYKNKVGDFLKKSSSDLCEEIFAIIELCKDNSVVITRTSNVIKHEPSGKETKKLIKDMEKPIKIVLTKNDIYEIDTSVHPDKRIFHIAKIPMGLVYLSYIDEVKEIKEKLDEQKERNVTSESEDIVKNAEEIFKGVKKCGDKELIELAKGELEKAKKFTPKKMQEISEKDKEVLRLRLKYCEKEIEKLKPLFENEFPPYSSIRN